MSTGQADGAANNAAVEQLRAKAGDSAVTARVEYLQRVVDATEQGVKGAHRKIDRAEQDMHAAHQALDEAEAQHAHAVGELEGFKTAAGVE